ncbi:MAG: SDR family oxidoreductase [Desulfohalobiaceae bacterium]|nr:SDR family oxidoreductase [Desulfohalobiaceae bacterium]
MKQDSTAAGESPLVLVLGGKHGLLGQAAARVFGDCGCRVAVQGREDTDPASRQSLQAMLKRWQPDWLVNAMGCNDYLAAERDPDAAYALNASLPGFLADMARRSGIHLVHFSSALVFNGEKRAPYTPRDRPNPDCVLGASKLAGERAIAESAIEDALIVRASWIFGPWKTNCVHTLLDRARTEKVLPVAHDVIGSPTYSLDLAYHTYQLLGQGARGIYHLSNSGRASWCELAAEALAATEYNVKVEPISSDQALKRAMRPRYHVLDISDFTRMVGQKPRPWPQALRDYMFSYEVRHLWGDAVGAT